MAGDGPQPGPGIGTLGERSLHAALKEQIAEPGDRFEVLVDGYVIDIVRGDLLIEVQTGSFAALKTKLAALLANHRVLLVHPIPAERWIVKMGPDGTTWLDRRRSPRRGKVTDVFRELVSFPHLAAHANLAIEVALTREEEVRVNDGQGSWRRKGWRIADRRLLDVAARQRFGGVGDYLTLLPPGLPDPFTTRDLAAGLGERIALAQKMAYCLHGMGAISRVGKQGNAYLYAVTRSHV